MELLILAKFAGGTFNLIVLLLYYLENNLSSFQKTIWMGCALSLTTMLFSLHETVQLELHEDAQQKLLVYAQDFCDYDTFRGIYTCETYTCETKNAVMCLPRLVKKGTP